MWSHFFRMFYRNLRKSWQYSLINSLGLAFGLTSVILIILFVFHEWSYDRFHENSQNKYRLLVEYRHKDGNQLSHELTAAFGPMLSEILPEIHSICRITVEESGFFYQEGAVIETKNLLYADSTFFAFFNFELLEGNPNEVLSGVQKIVLSETLASAIFKDADPIGKTVSLNGDATFLVTGIVKNPKSHSSIEFDAIMSFETLYQDKSRHMGINGGNQYPTFIELQDGSEKQQTATKMQAVIDEKVNKELEGTGFSLHVVLQELTDIHLNTIDPNAPMVSMLRMLMLVAFSILLTACFNFTNLATASGLQRSVEISIKKTIGATRKQLVFQHLGESFLLSFFAFVLALMFAEILLPAFNALTGAALTLTGSHPWFLPFMFLLVVFTAFVAGIYPAFYLSALEPTKILKGNMPTGRKNSIFAKMLIVLQFVIAAFFINSAWVIYSQLQYISHFDKGFKSKNVIAVVLPPGTNLSQTEYIRQTILQQPAVASCAAVSELPGGGVTMNGYLPEGHFQPVMIHVMDVDTSFLSVFGLQIKAGRNFRIPSATDQKAYIVNETFVKRFNYDDPIGKIIQRDGNYPIIGVVSDFHFAPIHSTIAPLLLTMHPYDGYNYLAVNLMTSSAEGMTQLEQVWRKQFPDKPFIAFPFEAYLEQSYVREQQLGKMIYWSTALALFIAAMGLFGLSALSLQQRIKELGIKKILGASSWQLTFSVIGNFSLLILIANCITIFPVYLGMDFYLSNFSYHVPIHPWMFVLNALFAWAISMVSIGIQAWKASRINLLEVIKYE
ncbi:MAG: ABC transporter permease [Bacteroidales bacterium]|nr:ABC transporter permease [Bacteroidales bacterium]